MALHEGQSASETLVPSRHQLGPLLGYFLAPQLAWNLCFEDVLWQVLEKNRLENERRQREATTSLNKCRSQRTRLHEEMDAVSKTLEATSNREACKEYEKKMEVLRTSLIAVEAAISRFENIIEECRMMEDDVRQAKEEAASGDQSDSREGAEDVEMVDQEVVSQLGSSNPHTEANIGTPPLLALRGDLVSPEEEEILLGRASQSKDRSSASETAWVSGGLAELQLASPSHSGTEDEGTAL